jgi:hypothetical protein
MPAYYLLPPKTGEEFNLIKAAFNSVCINLVIQLSHIQGHEIRIVLYARLDGGDLFSNRT